MLWVHMCIYLCANESWTPYIHLHLSHKNYGQIFEARRSGYIRVYIYVQMSRGLRIYIYIWVTNCIQISEARRSGCICVYIYVQMSHGLHIYIYIWVTNCIQISEARCWVHTCVYLCANESRTTRKHLSHGLYAHLSHELHTDLWVTNSERQIYVHVLSGRNTGLHVLGRDIGLLYSRTVGTQCKTVVTLYRALLTGYRARLTECRALLTGYRALLTGARPERMRTATHCNPIWGCFDTI